MITETDLKIKKYKNEIQQLNDKYEKNESKFENVAKGSLLIYSAGALLTPYTLITDHPHLAMASAAATILSISAFSLSLSIIVSNEKKINKLKQKIKKLEKPNNKSRNN